MTHYKELYGFQLTIEILSFSMTKMYAKLCQVAKYVLLTLVPSFGSESYQVNCQQFETV